MFSVKEILEATQGKLLSGSLKTVVRGVNIDSRHIKPHELFIAVKGEIFDGHDFIADVIKAKVAAIVVSKAVPLPFHDVAVIQVADTIKALGHLARAHRQRFKAPVIALTGSAGKTTTKEMVAAVLGAKYNVLKNEGTQNNHIGVPLTLFKLQDKHDMVVLECGTNQPGDIPWLADVARPTHVLFTNIGESHLEKLKNPLGVLKEKWTLSDFLPKGGTMIINNDDPLLSTKAARHARKWRIVTYGIYKRSTYTANAIIVREAKRLQFTLAGKTIELQTCGINNIYNSLAAYACGDIFGVRTKDAIKALRDFEFPPGRGQILKLGKGWLLNDAYNANPVSMRSALQTLEAISVAGKKIVVAADMLELGVYSKKYHEQIGTLIAKMPVDALITVGDLAKDIGIKARKQSKQLDVCMCKDVEGAKMRLAKVFENGDAVLVKGSRRMKMEQVVDFLLEPPA